MSSFLDPYYPRYRAISWTTQLWGSMAVAYDDRFGESIPIQQLRRLDYSTRNAYLPLRITPHGFATVIMPLDAVRLLIVGTPTPGASIHDVSLYSNLSSDESRLRSFTWEVHELNKSQMMSVQCRHLCVSPTNNALLLHYTGILLQERSMQC